MKAVWLNRLPWLVLAVGLAACTSAPVQPPPLLKDGQLGVPPGYRAWPKFLSAVQRSDLDEVREIYISPNAVGSHAAAGLPDGTVLVMETYAARTDAHGNVLAQPDGTMLAGPLERVLVMGKNAGWGDVHVEVLKNGRWIYASYLADGRAAPEDPMTCRVCHRQRAADRDFVPRYDEYVARQAQPR